MVAVGRMCCGCSSQGGCGAGVVCDGGCTNGVAAEAAVVAAADRAVMKVWQQMVHARLQ